MQRTLTRRWAPIASGLLLTLLVLASPLVQAQSNRDKAARFYEDALQRYERKDVAGAIIQLKNALQIDKSMLPGQVLLGRALLADGQAAAAEVAFREALRLGVDRAEVAVPLARSLSAQGKQVLIFEEQRLQPSGLPRATQVDLLLVRAAAHSDLGDSRSALKSVEDARALRPDTADTWLAEVPIRIRSRQFNEANAAADRALKLEPKSAEAHYQKGSVHHVLASLQPALAAYDAALLLDPGHVEARLARTGIRLDLGLAKEAELDLRELDSLAPGEPRAAYLRAVLAERKGDAAAARAALKTVTELLDPVPIEAIRFRPQVLMLNGMAHYGLNEFEKAKPYLEYALRQQPNSPLAKMLAQVAMLEPNMTRAVELLEGYLRARPGDGQAMLMLASAHMAQGRHAKATALMQEALRAKDAPEFRTALGMSLMRAGQSGNAIAELERAYRADPRQSHAGLALISLYLRSGQPDKAAKLAEGLVKSNPNNPSMLTVQGTVRLQLRDVKGARSSFEQALKLDALLTEARFGLARVDIAAKDFESARQRIAAVLKEQDRNVDALFEMALVNEAAGRDDEALKWLESAAEASNQRQTRANSALVAWHLRKGSAPKALDAAKQLLAKLPEDVEALQAYGAAQLANGDLAGARSTLANASRRAGFEASKQVQIAGALVEARDLAGAAYALDKALSVQPGDLSASALMTQVELALGETAKAERRAAQIITSHPKRSTGHTLMAEVALSRKQIGPATESLRRAHELEKSSASLLRLFGVLAGQDNGKPAIALAEGWLKTNPRDLQVQKALGDAHARGGNFAGARRVYEAALKTQPNDVELLNNLANALMRLNDPGALSIAEQALKLAPQSATVIDTAGWANHLAGNQSRALQLLRDARLREPSHPEIRYHLAAVLAKAGRTKEARDELTAILGNEAAFPSSVEAKELMRTLK